MSISGIPLSLERQAEHTGDPGLLSEVAQFGDWLKMKSFIHAPHTPAASTLNNLCLLKVVKESPHTLFLCSQKCGMQMDSQSVGALRFLAFSLP